MHKQWMHEGGIATPLILHWEHIENRTIRADNWKLVTNRRSGTWELYNLATDPTELVDFAPSHPDVVQRMATVWQSWADSVGVRPH